MSEQNGYAIVTGASQGLGEAIAMELAARGFGILGVARSGDKLQGVMERAGALNGGRAHALVLDVAAADAVERIMAEVARQGLHVTCLVNNAGQGLYGRFRDVPVEEQVRMMHLNMDVPVRLTHALLPTLRKASRAYVLNIASMVAYSPLGTMSAYCGSKAFVWRWSRSLRLEERDGPVRVTCVNPGSIITGFTARANMTSMDALARKFGTGPVPVARTAVKAMLRGKAEVVPGTMNAVMATLQQLLPTALIERVASGVYFKHLPR